MTIRECCHKRALPNSVGGNGRPNVVGADLIRDLWERLMGETYGRDLWERLVGATCGSDLWERLSVAIVGFYSLPRSAW